MVKNAYPSQLSTCEKFNVAGRLKIAIYPARSAHRAGFFKNPDFDPITRNRPPDSALRQRYGLAIAVLLQPKKPGGSEGMSGTGRAVHQRT